MKKRIAIFGMSLICSAGLYFGTATSSTANSIESGGYYVKFPCIIGKGNYCAMNGNGCGLASRCKKKTTIAE